MIHLEINKLTVACTEEFFADYDWCAFCVNVNLKIKSRVREHGEND